MDPLHPSESWLCPSSRPPPACLLLASRDIPPGVRGSGDRETGAPSPPLDGHLCRSGFARPPQYKRLFRGRGVLLGPARGGTTFFSRHSSPLEARLAGGELDRDAHQTFFFPNCHPRLMEYAFLGREFDGRLCSTVLGHWAQGRASFPPPAPNHRDGG